MKKISGLKRVRELKAELDREFDQMVARMQTKRHHDAVIALETLPLRDILAQGAGASTSKKRSKPGGRR